MRLGILYNLIGRSEDAKKHFKKALKLNPFQIDALTMIIRGLIKDKKIDAAIRLCEQQKKKIKNNPVYAASIENVQGTVYLADNNLKKAGHHFEKAIELNPDTLQAYVSLAKIFISDNRIDKAIVQYKKLLNKKPDYLVGYMALGSIYDQQGDKTKAETNYRKALEIKSNFAPAANNLAWNIIETGGNVDEALKYAQIAKEQMPKNSSIMDTLGWVYYLKGSYINAISEFNDSLALNPENPVFNYHLGMAFYKNKESDKAKKMLEKAIKLDPKFRGVQDAKNILAEINKKS